MILLISVAREMPELDGGAGAVAGVVLERALDVLALEVLEAERRVTPVADAGTRAELTRQMLDAHRRPTRGPG